MNEIKLFIHGEYVSAGSGKTFDNYNPATGELISKVHLADQSDVDRAVASAEEGFMEWSSMTGVERGRILMKAQKILKERNDELARLETIDSGKPIIESSTVDIYWGADCLEYYAGLAATISGESMSFPNSLVYTRREPLGVCAGLGAWNYPLQVACWKLAPALTCGNSMVYKPAELTPITSTILAEIMMEAGTPPGVFNVVHGYGETGSMLSRHPGIAKISLTGEVGTGKKVMADAASNLKVVTLELGGKSPIIVFDDADIHNAVSAVMMGNFFTQGEICTNGTRVYLHEKIRKKFTDELVSRTKKLKLGDTLDQNTQIGSLISRDHQEKVMGFIRKGLSEGAELLTGGEIPTDEACKNGNFVIPTIFDNCRDDMSIVREEIFGPVLSLLTFTDEEDVIRRANDTRYGLAAGVFTADIKRAHRIVSQLQAGYCWINNYGVMPLEMPFGGMKESGLGSENGTDTIRLYTQLKTVYIELDDVECDY